MTNTILPADQKSLARKMFTDLVNEEAKILLVILGKGPDAEKSFARAKKLTGSEGKTWRHVCWARKPEQIAEEIANLKNSDQLADLTAVRAFSLSYADKVCYVVPMSDEPLDYDQVFDLYAYAEKGLGAGAGGGGR